MRLAFYLVALVATPAAAQTTRCTQLGNTIDCKTDNSAERGQAQLDRAMQNLVDSTRPPAVVVRPPPAPTPRPEDRQSIPYPSVSSKERRKEAYAQVGALIARGDCPAAMRLARFYGQDDLIGDTAKACESKQ